MRRPAPGRSVGDAAAPLLAVALWILLFSAACLLHAARPLVPAGTGPTGEAGVLDRTLGALRFLVAERATVAADVYYHGGVGHAAAPRRDPFRAWSERLDPVRHVHLHGAEAAEMLPWLRAATALDAGDVETWLLTAYWVERVGAEAGEVEGVYRRARQAHPRNYRVPQQQAFHRLRTGDWDGAETLLRLALRLWPQGEEDDPDHALRDRAHVASALGLLREVAGDAAAAEAGYREALAARPGHETAAEGLRRAAQGGDPVEARRVLRRLAAEEPAPHACDHHDHHHHH